MGLGGEKVWSDQPSLPLSWFLSLPLSLSPFLSQEKRPLGLNKQITWPSNTTHHCCTGTSFRRHFTGLCSVLIPTSKRRTHSRSTHTHARKHTHCWVSPSTWQWFYKSPQCEVSYSLSSTRTTSAVRAQGERGKRDNSTIELLLFCFAGRVVDKAHKKGCESCNWFVMGSWCQLPLKLWPI